MKRAIPPTPDTQDESSRSLTSVPTSRQVFTFLERVPPTLQSIIALFISCLETVAPSASSFPSAAVPSRDCCQNLSSSCYWSYLCWSPAAIHLFFHVCYGDLWFVRRVFLSYGVVGSDGGGRDGDHDGISAWSRLFLTTPAKARARKRCDAACDPVSPCGHSFHQLHDGCRQRMLVEALPGCPYCLPECRHCHVCSPSRSSRPKQREGEVSSPRSSRTFGWFRAW